MICGRYGSTGGGGLPESMTIAQSISVAAFTCPACNPPAKAKKQSDQLAANLRMIFS
jgi:hypothetical protein